LVAAARSGCSEWQRLEHEATESLAAHGWQPDYVAVRRQSDLREPAAQATSTSDPLVVLAAARLGGVRLIDNVEI
jgi:pantoate--beta-alanine ligase